MTSKSITNNSQLTVNYGTTIIEYSLVYQDRNSIRLDVMPDCTIIVFAPVGSDKDRIDNFLKRKYLWIKKQQEFFAKHSTRQSKKDYVSGESFLYLGRQYILKVVPSQENKVKLGYRVIEVFTTDTAYKQVKKLFDKWLHKRMKIVFNKRLVEMNKVFGYVNLPTLSIRKMNKRWGSYKTNGEIVLNSDLIQASSQCIDYVIAHELTHVKYKNHDKDFYTHLESKVPNWKQRKESLEDKIFGG